MIAKIFLFGALCTIPVYFSQIYLKQGLSYLSLPTAFFSVIYWFLIIALTEELFKYLAVKLGALSNPEFDEPVDAMIYMVISALGFAAIENILYIASSAINVPIEGVFSLAVFMSIARFVGATFLHTLCSGILGYFIALSYAKPKDKLRLFILGIFAAVLLHGFYNFSIMNIKGPNIVAFSVLFMIGFNALLASLVFPRFKELRKMKSISNIK